MVNTGYEWEAAFRNSVLNTYPGAFVHKLVDTHSIEGILRYLKSKGPGPWSQYKVPKVPADFILLNDGDTTWAECKDTSNLKGFPMRNIKPHQLEAATNIEGAGGQFIFVIRRKEPRNNRAWLVSATGLYRIKSTIATSIIPWDEFKGTGVVELNRIKGGLFEMEGLFNVN